MSASEEEISSAEGAKTLEDFRVDYNIQFGEKLCDKVILGGNFEHIKEALSLGCPLDPKMSSKAAKEGQFDILHDFKE